MTSRFCRVGSTVTVAPSRSAWDQRAAEGSLMITALALTSNASWR
jgi:hypothetical protein